jgi:hypothetical protein
MASARPGAPGPQSIDGSAKTWSDSWWREPMAGPRDIPQMGYAQPPAIWETLCGAFGRTLSRRALA